MELQRAVDRFLASPSLSEATRRAYRVDVRQFADWLAARGEEQGVVRALGEPWPPVPEIACDPEGGLLPERHDPLFAALAVHADGLLLEVDVGQVEADRFGAAQAGGVHQLDQRPVAERQRFVTFERLDDCVDLVAAGSVREAAVPARRERDVRDA